jgi:hypothetical protein
MELVSGSPNAAYGNKIADTFIKAAPAARFFPEISGPFLPPFIRGKHSPKSHTMTTTPEAPDPGVGIRVRRRALTI